MLLGQKLTEEIIISGYKNINDFCTCNNITVPTVLRIIKNDRNTSIKTLNLIASALDLTLQELLQDVDIDKTVELIDKKKKSK